MKRLGERKINMDNKGYSLFIFFYFKRSLTYEIFSRLKVLKGNQYWNILVKDCLALISISSYFSRVINIQKQNNS